jgi:hypothetical protein
MNFAYNEKEMNLELSFNQQATEIDMKKNKMKIIVYERNKEIKNETEIFHNDIICLLCGELIFLSINDYKIELFECKNGHKVNDILLEVLMVFKILKNLENLVLVKKVIVMIFINFIFASHAILIYVQNIKL